MKQVVQPAAGGHVQILDVPQPEISPAEVLVQTFTSVISPGTERAVTALARASLLAKARARPDLVRQVAHRARADGVTAAMHAVRSRLAADVPLGYSAAGRVLAVGSAVGNIRPGQLVATGGAGKACHAEVQAVPGLLCAVIPDGVRPADAAFTTIASISLHALRLADAGAGAKIAVIGLGLIGQLAARLALAAGCDVVGMDPDPRARAMASQSGMLALADSGPDALDQVSSWSRGRGADAVLVCAAGRSSAPVLQAPELCRDRAVVVIVGDVGLELQREPFYQREISVRFARSYGPGRYEPSYEDWGVDYPAGQVRWTEGRNFEAVLDLLASRRLAVDDLVTHTFPIEAASAAYELIEKRTEPYLAIRLQYPAAAAQSLPVLVPGRAAGPRPDLVPAPRTAIADGMPAGGAAPGRATSAAGRDPGVGWLGAGSFTASTLLPAFRRAGFANLVAIASASGVSARRVADRQGFSTALSGAEQVITYPGVSVVVIATPHDSHARLVGLALRAGRHVWCEKPVALSLEEHAEVEAAWRDSGRQLAIGFNRRWSPAVRAATQALSGVTAPRQLVYRVAAGLIPAGHWYADRRQGGRLLGEACHFVDTAQVLIGSSVTMVTCVPGRARGTGGGRDDGVISLGFADGSLAAICYGSGHPRAGKELIEITAARHRVVIDDFRSVAADGRTVWKGRQDKGHQRQAAAFRLAVTGGAQMPTAVLLATARATIQAVAGADG